MLSDDEFIESCRSIGGYPSKKNDIIVCEIVDHAHGGYSKIIKSKSGITYKSSNELIKIHISKPEIERFEKIDRKLTDDRKREIEKLVRKESDIIVFNNEEKEFAYKKIKSILHAPDEDANLLIYPIYEIRDIQNRGLKIYPKDDKKDKFTIYIKGDGRYEYSVDMG